MWSFDEAVHRIHGLEKRGWRLGLDRMREFVRLAGLEDALGPDSPAFVHIAGTNGKGTTTAFTQSILIEQGHRTGSFFSPFVYDVRERVQVDRELIAPADFATIAERLFQAAAPLEGTHYEGISEFELKTALGFAYWKFKQCDWVALEVGLGGRLDATNVIQSRATVITSIGWDHMHILGNTLEKIAAEKAGVLRPGVPLILGKMEPGPRQIILDIASEIGAPVWEIGREIILTDDAIATPTARFENLRPRLRGAKVRENMALAIAACHAAGAVRDPDLVAAGVERASLPGRFEIRNVEGQEFVLDGAHNLDSAEVLATSLQQEGMSDVILITNMLHGHDPEPFFRTIQPFVSHTIIAPIDFARARAPQETASILQGMGWSTEVATDALDAINRAKAHSPQRVLVTGSFYLVGDIGRTLGPYQAQN